VGQVNQCSPDHISLLVHRTFNASIPRHHIPTDTWEFEYGPAENDPEFGPSAAEQEENGDKDVSEQKEAEDGGRWINKVTGTKIGSPDGFLEFTVIG
jgi:DNA-directed RNA polymerase I subunit RPA43